MPTISDLSRSSGRKTSAISSSFQTHSALTTTSVTKAGAESGITICHSRRKWDAPSAIADSSSSSGIVLKKLVSR